MVAGSAPLPAGSSCLLAFLWSSCRSVCHWVNLTNTALIRLALSKRRHAQHIKATFHDGSARFRFYCFRAVKSLRDGSGSVSDL